jgi:hypothetical protein
MLRTRIALAVLAVVVLLFALYFLGSPIGPNLYPASPAI